MLCDEAHNCESSWSSVQNISLKYHDSKILNELTVLSMESDFVTKYGLL